MPSDRESLNETADLLSPGRLRLLLDMARAMEGDIPHHLDYASDVCTPRFSEYFSNLVRLHHATAPPSQRFWGKQFEYAFVAACIADLKDARIVRRSTNPGADAVVDGVGFSLKSNTLEGKPPPDSIKITKLMEAAWLKSCTSKEELAEKAVDMVTAHLARYNRVIVLKIAPPVCADFLDYQLWEIPHELLSKISTLRVNDFNEPSKNYNSCGAYVTDSNNARAFRLKLDGNDDKVQIEKLRTDLCRLHGSWRIETPVPDNDAEAPTGESDQMRLLDF